MSYTALYRKFRPTAFEDVKGQDHIVTTLKNQIKAERTSHAYLFCGTRGTGKTTIAKIFARAVNCENPVDGSPCGECAICRAIAAGASMNVIEIDAASNNGVDSIREIVDEVTYSPAEGKYKVYIIDEVHMLSIGAFNALLKTLEEPPSYVIFILATTEVHKIPITILSRCQRYDFKRITIDTISDRIKELVEKEQVRIEERAIRYIAKTADGSMRDALSLYDQCIAFYFGQKLSYDMVLDVLGAVDTDIFYHLLEYVLQQDITRIVELLEHMIIMGRDLSQFVVDFIWYLRNLLLLQTSDQAEELIDVSTEQRNALKEMAKRLSVETVIHYIRILSELSGQIKYATQKRVLIEIAFVKLCRPQMERSHGLENIEERLHVLEERLEQSAMISKEQLQGLLEKKLSSMETKVLTENENITVNRELSPVCLEPAVPEELAALAGQWSAVIGRLKGGLKSMLLNARPSVGNDHQLLLVFHDKTAEGFVNTQEHLKEIETVIETILKKKVQVSTKLITGALEEGEFLDLRQLDLKKLGVHAEIEYID